MRVTEEFILKRIDDYEIFCHYLNDDIKIGKAYRSPFHVDKKPSFSLYIPEYPSNNFFERGFSLCFKDFSLGIWGDVFVFISILFNISKSDAILKIANDLLNTNYEIKDIKLVHKNRIKKQKEGISINIVTKDFDSDSLNYWNEIGINKDTLNKYNTNQLLKYTINNNTFLADKYSFSYEVCGKYQIYQPFSKYKFFNNLESNMFFGYLQLPENGDKLIIDKSNKDIMFCDEVLNIPAISPKAEGIMIPELALLELKDRFSNIYLMLDNDKAGHKATLKYIQKYKFLKPIFLPLDKDKTDCAKRVGVNQAREHILNIINEYNNINNFKFL